MRCILLVATNDLRASPEYSGLHLLRLFVQNKTAGEYSAHVIHFYPTQILSPWTKKSLLVVQNIAAGEYSAHVIRLLSDTNPNPLDKGESPRRKEYSCR